MDNTEHDGCYFLDEMSRDQLMERLQQAVDTLDEERRVLEGIARRLLNG